MQINESIFKAYDIRGTYPDQINEENAYLIGRAYATFLKKNFHESKTVAVGSDMRLSSPALKAKVIQALLDTGLDVDDLGLVSTPTFYFAVAYYSYDGGLQISASHNPKEWNGVKIVSKGGNPVSRETGINEMLALIQYDQLLPLAEAKGKLGKRENIVHDQIEDQIKNADISKIKPLRVVIDNSNGMGAPEMRALFEKLPCELIEMNFEPDGSFPAHGADPMEEKNILDLKNKVVERRADLGIAIDGDADRYFFVDEKGESMPQSILRGLMAQIVLKDHPGAKIGYDIRPGRITRDMIEQAGGIPLLTPVGHSLIKGIMIKEGAVFGGESSGHYCFKLDYGTFEAPIVLVAKLLEYISEQGKPLSEIIAPYKKYFQSGEVNIHARSREEGEAKIEEIKMKYSDGKQNLLDGVSVEYPDYWFNLRMSNTEPLIRLAVEGTSREIVASKVKEIEAILAK